MLDKIIVNFTPTGMIPQKHQTPFVPISIDEIVEDVRLAHEQGITMVHLHIRNENGEPDYRKEIYGRLILRIRELSKELVVCVSTSGRTFSEIEKRSEVLDLEGILKPDMASLTLSSVNFNKEASINSPDIIQALARKMIDKNIKPEIEIFDLGMVNYMKYLIRKGLLIEPYYVNIIVGNVSTAQLDLSHIGLILKELPENCFVSIGGVGEFQLPANSLAISQNYGVRVGIEDNYWYDTHRTIKAKNIDLLRRIHRIIVANEKTQMSSKELRSLLNLTSLTEIV